MLSSVIAVQVGRPKNRRSYSTVQSTTTEAGVGTPADDIHAAKR